TDAKTVERMIVLADIQPGELAVDLGCGDGRLLQAAAKAGADTMGYELSLILYLLARWRGVNVRYRNLWKADVSQADVVFCYLVPRAAARFEREIWPRLKPSCRIVVNAFPLPNLKPIAADGTVYRYDKI
ncbi:MAG: methionine biosynthesis protein MetW, partial [Candidatus Omnitrophota bacterium]